jgi:hypothetical protein
MRKTSTVMTFTALAVAAVLNGCASDTSAQQPVAAAPAPVEQAPVAETKPGAAEIGRAVVNAKVKAVDKKNRVVTLQFPDGKRSKVKCGPEVRNFPQIRVGDDVKMEFVESMELFVADAPEQPSADAVVDVQRAPKGAKPGVQAVESVEVKATVEAINYDTREVTLKGPEGNLQKLVVGPEAKRFNEVKQGDTVVARLTKAVAISVTTPTQK